MAVKLKAEDYRVLVEILRDLEAFRSVEGRWALVEMALEGNPRAPHVLGQLNLDLSRQAAAGMVIKRLADFGQVAYGREALGLLLNHIEPLVSDEQQPIIRDVLKRYALEAEAPPKPLSEWCDARSVEAVKERIIGENTLRHVNVLEKALAAARAVVQVSVPENGSKTVGTGFMVGPDLLMTNEHVIGNAAQTRGAEFSFFYELDLAGLARPKNTVSAAEKGLLHTNPDLDYAVIRLQDPPAFGQPLRLRGEHLRKDARVAIIQHPGGTYKQISMQNNFVAYADDRVIQSDLPPGNSNNLLIYRWNVSCCDSGVGMYLSI
jgi:DNA-binding transcriptional regulator of glucitol operon